MKKEIFGKNYADQYDNIYADKDYESESDLLKSIFLKQADSEIHTVLDLGCGTGNHAIPLAARGYSVTGVDTSEEMLSKARSKAILQTETSGMENLEFVKNDVRFLDLGRTFDAVIMMFAVLGYQLTNQDVSNTLRAVRRHLRPGGLFIFDVWYGPGVLVQQPSERVKITPIPNGSLIRTTSGELDIRHHLCEVHYQLWRIVGDQVMTSTKESHTMRYFFPMEIEQWLFCSDMVLESLTALPEEKPEDQTSWNVLGIGRALVA